MVIASGTGTSLSILTLIILIHSIIYIFRAHLLFSDKVTLPNNIMIKKSVVEKRLNESREAIVIDQLGGR